MQLWHCHSHNKTAKNLLETNRLPASSMTNICCRQHHVGLSSFQPVTDPYSWFILCGLRRAQQEQGNGLPRPQAGRCWESKATLAWIRAKRGASVYLWVLQRKKLQRQAMSELASEEVFSESYLFAHLIFFTLKIFSKFPYVSKPRQALGRQQQAGQTCLHRVRIQVQGPLSPSVVLTLAIQIARDLCLPSTRKQNLCSSHCCCFSEKYSSSLLHKRRSWTEIVALQAHKKDLATYNKHTSLFSRYSRRAVSLSEAKEICVLAHTAADATLKKA